MTDSCAGRQCAQPGHALCAVRAQRQAKLQAALEELMTLVLRTVNDKKDHIPPVVSSAVLTFSFDISIAGCVRAHAALTGLAAAICLPVTSLFAQHTSW